MTTHTNHGYSKQPTNSVTKKTKRYAPQFMLFRLIVILHTPLLALSSFRVHSDLGPPLLLRIMLNRFCYRWICWNNNVMNLWWMPPVIGFGWSTRRIHLLCYHPAMMQAVDVKNSSPLTIRFWHWLDSQCLKSSSPLPIVGQASLSLIWRATPNLLDKNTILSVRSGSGSRSSFLVVDMESHTKSPWWKTLSSGCAPALPPQQNSETSVATICSYAPP